MKKAVFEIVRLHGIPNGEPVFHTSERAILPKVHLKPTKAAKVIIYLFEKQMVSFVASDIPIKIATQPTVNKALSILREAEVITSTKKGRRRWYYVDLEALKNFIERTGGVQWKDI